MSLQFNMIALLLVFLIVLGLMSQNSAITISAAVLLIMQQTLLSKYIPVLEQYGVKIGIIILTIGVLAPLVSGKSNCLISVHFKLENGHLYFNRGISGVASRQRRAINGRTTRFSDWIINWYDYWCVFLRWDSGRSTYRRRYFSDISRKILDEKQMVIYRWVKRFLCVTIGAFAAHGLSKVLEPKELAWIETGVRYQMFHTIAIFAIGILQLCREALVAKQNS